MTNNNNIPKIPHGADGAVIVQELPREITSWQLAGLMACDGRAFLQCTFQQDVGGEPNPECDGEYVNVTHRTFTVHWELDSLKEFVRHLLVAAGEIERRAGVVDMNGFDISAEVAKAIAGSPRPVTVPDVQDNGHNGHHPGYL